jgi:hypothetical protein
VDYVLLGYDGVILFGVSQENIAYIFRLEIFPETLVPTYKTARHHSSEDHNAHFYRRETSNLILRLSFHLLKDPRMFAQSPCW